MWVVTNRVRDTSVTYARQVIRIHIFMLSDEKYMHILHSFQISNRSSKARLIIYTD